MRNLLILVLATLMTSTAQAAIFDFAAVADGDSSYGLPGGEGGAASLTFNKGGVSVTASGFNGLDGTPYYAYLDATFNNLSGGLGVCMNLVTNAQCNPSSDDNVTTNETLRLVFDQAVTINSTTFVNGNHGTNFTGNFDLSIDGGTATTYSLTNIFAMDLTGTTFEFFNPNVGAGSAVSNDKQFYINALDVTVVPVPAAAWLFGSGLLGLLGMARRKA